MSPKKAGYLIKGLSETGGQWQGMYTEPERKRMAI